jgi:hypothetical protein
LGVLDAPGAVKVLVSPARHGQEMELADVNANDDSLALTALEYPLGHDPVDCHGGICFALSHGDDLLHAGS